MRALVQWWRCWSCGHVYPDATPDGTPLYHVCSPRYNPATERFERIPDARDESPDPAAYIKDKSGAVVKFPYRPTAEGKGREPVDPPAYAVAARRRSVPVFLPPLEVVSMGSSLTRKVVAAGGAGTVVAGVLAFLAANFSLTARTPLGVAILAGVTFLLGLVTRHVTAPTSE